VKGRKAFLPLKVRLSQEKMPVESPTQQQSWVRGRKRGERPFSPPPAKLGEGREAVGWGERPFHCPSLPQTLML